jgi:hypothetical protein
MEQPTTEETQRQPGEDKKGGGVLGQGEGGRPGGGILCVHTCLPSRVLAASSPRRDGGARARALSPVHCWPDEFPVSRASPNLSTASGCNRDGPVCV